MQTDDSWKDLFFKEAFFLYENKEKIYADVRMFLTPLPFKNNLAYTGAAGMQGATLGVYLKWWDQCDEALLKKNGEVYALTYFIAGSPSAAVTAALQSREMEILLSSVSPVCSRLSGDLS